MSSLGRFSMVIHLRPLSITCPAASHLLPPSVPYPRVDSRVAAGGFMSRRGIQSGEAALVSQAAVAASVSDMQGTLCTRCAVGVTQRWLTPSPHTTNNLSELN